MLLTSATDSSRSRCDSVSMVPQRVLSEAFDAEVCTNARRNSRSFCMTTFSIRFEKMYTGGAKTREVAVNCLTCWTVWSLKAPISEQPGVHLAAVSMWYRNCVRLRITLTVAEVSRSLDSKAIRNFFSFRSITANGPLGLSAASHPPFLHAVGQLAGSPVQLAASEDLIRLKQLLHIISKSSMSLAAAGPKDGRATCWPLACGCTPPWQSLAPKRAATFGSVLASLCKYNSLRCPMSVFLPPSPVVSIEPSRMGLRWARSCKKSYFIAMFDIMLVVCIVTRRPDR
mmetsp:Transcript_20259/g.57348  ORF Transcript_20259/g.57348 Transcript_20259/m.57348 type:complete len:285 (-) Transcript_20259:54-908(-)